MLTLETLYIVCIPHKFGEVDDQMGGKLAGLCNGLNKTPKTQQTA